MNEYALRRLDELSKNIQPEIIYNATLIVKAMSALGVHIHNVVPDEDNNIAFIWHTNGVQVYITVTAYNSEIWVNVL